MVDYGITDAGFVKKPLPVIQQEQETALQGVFGQSINLQPQSRFGQIVGIYSERESAIWDLAEATYFSRYRGTASGVPLQNAVGLIGIAPLKQTKSAVQAQVTGTAGTVIGPGKVFSVAGTGARFDTIETQTIPVGGTVLIQCESEDYGPIAAPAGTLTVIETPIAGVTAVTNLLDATLGRKAETDAEMRDRANQSLESAGSGTAAAIRDKVMNLTGVTAVKVIENWGSIPDASGRPPRSFETLVLGGVDLDIANMIWTAKAAGMTPYGNHMVTITDSEGYSQNVSFSRPVPIPIYVGVTVGVDSSFPSDGATQIQNAIDAYGLTLDVNQAVYTWKLYTAINSIPGIETATILIGTAPSPSGAANIPIGVTSIAAFDTSRITVTVNPI